MVSNQRKKGRDKARAERTGASRASAATGKVHRHEPVPDMSMLNNLPHAAGNPLNLDFAGRLVAASRAGCAPCQNTLMRKVVDRHRPTLAALAGAVCGLEMNTVLQYSPTVSATTRSWALLAQQAAESRDGAAAFTAVEAMDTTQAGELLNDVLDHWAAGGVETDEITDMLNVLRAGPPRRGPADPMTPFREAGVRVLTLDDLGALTDDIDPYHLGETYGIYPGQTATPDGQPLPMITLYPETEGAGIRDLEARTEWEHWGMYGLPAMDPNWRVRARIADRSLQGLALIGSDGEDDIELWRAAESISMPEEWWALLDRVQHVMVVGPVGDPTPRALNEAAKVGELLAVIARVSFH